MDPVQEAAADPGESSQCRQGDLEVTPEGADEGREKAVCEGEVGEEGAAPTTDEVGGAPTKDTQVPLNSEVAPENIQSNSNDWAGAI